MLNEKEGICSGFYLPERGEKIIPCARWYSDSYGRASFLNADGTLVLTQKNGQVCFLKLYQGANRITLEELLLHLGFSVEPNNSQTA